jgi:hypothetical protein
MYFLVFRNLLNKILEYYLKLDFVYKPLSSQLSIIVLGGDA